MDRWLKLLLIEYFSGKKTIIDDQILHALNLCKSDLTVQIVFHYFKGGSYKCADSEFNISQATYYNHINRFKKIVEILIKKEVKFNVQ